MDEEKPEVDAAGEVDLSFIQRELLKAQSMQNATKKDKEKLNVLRAEIKERGGVEEELVKEALAVVKNALRDNPSDPESIAGSAITSQLAEMARQQEQREADLED